MLLTLNPKIVPSFFFLLAATLSFATSKAQTSNPSTTATFQGATAGMSMVKNYSFGTGQGRNVPNLSVLADSFNPYGIAGKTVINQEWEIYQPFNPTNFVFTDDSLDLTAAIPRDGGLFPGGIHSGQIWSKDVYKPGVTGCTTYAVEVRMKIPAGVGMWPTAWFYTQMPGTDDGSEIDNPEFLSMQNQTEFDWTGFNHGPGLGADIYSIKTNAWLWHPKLNFSADYHDYQMVWTPTAVYKYVDGTLIYAQSFKWTASGPGSFALNLAVGSSSQSLPGLQPTSLSQFPASLSVEHVTIWGQR